MQQQYPISEVLRVQWLSLCGSIRHPVVTSGQLSNEPQFENKLLLQHQIPACTSTCFSSPNVVIELGSCWISLRQNCSFEIKHAFCTIKSVTPSLFIMLFLQFLYYTTEKAAETKDEVEMQFSNVNQVVNYWQSSHLSETACAPASLGKNHLKIFLHRFFIEKG